MTEYWVSQAKFYCKFCKVWISDNKQSRSLHDSGISHKRNVEFFHKQKRDQKLHGARTEQELQQQLAQIERAAQEAMLNEKLGTSSLTESASVDSSNGGAAYYGTPPPPPIRNVGDTRPTFTINSSFPKNNVTKGNAPILSSKAVEEISENLRGNSSGIYTVRGVTYLEGQLHESQLLSGTSCEIFVENLDDWLPATILNCMETTVPHTSITMKTFSVSYTIQCPEGKGQTATESEVKSDRLRLILDSNKFQVSESGDDIVEIKHKPVVVESTGLGAWTTVSVRVVDEEEEEQERLRLEAEERAATEKLKLSKDKERAVLAEELAQLESDSALGAFDPYNTGVYKGIKIGADTVHDEIDSISNGVQVGFKKRKSASGPAKPSSSIRVFRRKDEE